MVHLFGPRSCRFGLAYQRSCEIDSEAVVGACPEGRGRQRTQETVTQMRLSRPAPSPSSSRDSPSRAQAWDPQSTEIVQRAREAPGAHLMVLDAVEPYSYRSPADGPREARHVPALSPRIARLHFATATDAYTS